jgi:hypothetical protein
MAIAAKISPAELTAQVTNRFVGKYYEARLIYAPGTSYIPGTTNDATFLSNEVAAGTGGYVRQVISYTGGDVSAYSDDGVALTTKATVFAQDGGATAISFSHVALVEGNGNVTALAANSGAPTAGVNGTYTDLPTVTGGSGTGLTVDLTITNSGAASTDYALTIKQAGHGYAASDSIQVQEAALVAAGAVAASAGNITTTASTVYSSSQQLLSVAQTPSTVNLNGGNETVFYWNLKQFGFYTV